MILKKILFGLTQLCLNKYKLSKWNECKVLRNFLHFKIYEITILILKNFKTALFLMLGRAERPRINVYQRHASVNYMYTCSMN